MEMFSTWWWLCLGAVILLVAVNYKYGSSGHSGGYDDDCYCYHDDD